MKGDEALKMFRTGKDESFRAVGQRFYPVQHSHRNPAAAYGADARNGVCILRFQTYFAVPVSVKVVFSFLREKFDRAVKFLRIPVLKRP